MSIKDKTIGPMTLNCERKWTLAFGAWLCSESLQELFNIPNTAKKLWITLTKRRPKHHDDAIHVKLGHGGYAKFDNDKHANTYIGYQMCGEAEDFGSDFYATIYYE